MAPIPGSEGQAVLVSHSARKQHHGRQHTRGEGVAGGVGLGRCQGHRCGKQQSRRAGQERMHFVWNSARVVLSCVCVCVKEKNLQKGRSVFLTLFQVGGESRMCGMVLRSEGRGRCSDGSEVSSYIARQAPRSLHRTIRTNGRAQQRSYLVFVSRLYCLGRVTRRGSIVFL